MDNKTLYGIRAAAKHANVSRETIRNWIERGLPKRLETLGNNSVIVFESDDIDVFSTVINHKPGRPPKQVAAES